MKGNTEFKMNKNCDILVANKDNPVVQDSWGGKFNKALPVGPEQSQAFFPIEGYDRIYNTNIEGPVLIQAAPVHPNAKMPTKSYDHALGWDFYCVADEDFVPYADGQSEKRGYRLRPYRSHTFNLGIKVALTPANYGFILFDRSGLGVGDITRTAGVIEGTWRGEYKVHLINLSNESRTFYEGDKIIQGVLQKVIPATLQQVEEKDLPPSIRGERGFGSSG